MYLEKKKKMKPYREGIKQRILEKIENEYKSLILTHINGQEEWEKLKTSLEAAFAEKESKINKAIKDIIGSVK